MFGRDRADLGPAHAAALAAAEAARFAPVAPLGPRAVQPPRPEDLRYLHPQRTDDRTIPR